MEPRIFENNTPPAEVTLDRSWTIPLYSPLLQYTLFSYVPDEAAILAAASEQFAAMLLYRRAYGNALKQLLQHIAKGEAKEAAEIARLNYSLIYKKGSFQEQWCGQRKWKAVSPLQYAAWAGNAELVTCFLNGLPTLEAKKIAFQQLQEVKEKGTEHGAHLSPVRTLINKYSEYITQHGRSSPEIKHRFWIHELGKCQLHSVAHLIQWYCTPLPFAPIPDFNQPLQQLSYPLSGEVRARCLDLSVTSQLGIAFTLAKGSWKKGTVACPEPLSSRFAQQDYAAVNQFYIVRTANLVMQLAQLEVAIQTLAQRARSPVSPYSNKILLNKVYP